MPLTYANPLQGFKASKTRDRCNPPHKTTDSISFYNDAQIFYLNGLSNHVFKYIEQKVKESLWLYSLSINVYMLKAIRLTNSSQLGNKPKLDIMQLTLTFDHHLISIFHIQSAIKNPGRIKKEINNSDNQKQEVLPTTTSQLQIGIINYKSPISMGF